LAFGLDATRPKVVDFGLIWFGLWFGCRPRQRSMTLDFGV
jgi:hypothetical protein